MVDKVIHVANALEAAFAARIVAHREIVTGEKIPFEDTASMPNRDVWLYYAAAAIRAIEEL